MQTLAIWKNLKWGLTALDLELCPCFPSSTQNNTRPSSQREEKQLVLALLADTAGMLVYNAACVPCLSVCLSWHKGPIANLAFRSASLSVRSTWEEHAMTHQAWVNPAGYSFLSLFKAWWPENTAAVWLWQCHGSPDMHPSLISNLFIYFYEDQIPTFRSLNS